MMKRAMRLATSTLLVLLLILNLSTLVFAAGTVIYEGDSQKFIFEPGSDFSPTDLFSGFKELMPGDTVTEQIVIRNDASNGVKVKLYIRAKGAQEGSEKLLSQLRLKVEQDGASVLFDAPADQTAQMADWVYLGTFYSGAEIDLNVTLEVPITLGNDFQNAAGSLLWEFRAEEYPIELTDPDLPQTGDPSNPMLWFLLALCSSAAAMTLLWYGKRHLK